MFQTFRLLHIIVFIFLNISLCLDAYVIYTTNAFKTSAQQIATLHSETIPNELGLPILDTQIVYKEIVGIDTFIENLENNFDDFDKKYLLIIGDETIISSLTAVYGDAGTQCDSQYDTEYTDDLFNKNFAIGRLIVNNNEDALDQIHKIENYILNSELGIWKNKILLIADDENNYQEPNVEQEFMHTTYTDDIYAYLKDKTIVNTLYGTHYSNQQSIFTDLIINSINSGVSLINYIGHGSLKHLAHEDILVLNRDIDLINTNNRPPIWVVGTCSFAHYNDDEICFAEELLKKPDAAIAIIATTAGVIPTISSNYLNAFYNRLSSSLIDPELYGLRIGDILKYAKGDPPDPEEDHSAYDCLEYTYQLFGDPALPIIISKQDNDIFEVPDNIMVGAQNSLDINYEGNSYIKIIAEDITYSVDINDNETIEYHSFGGTLFESYFSNQIDYYVPFDITAEKARIMIYNTRPNNRSSNYQHTIQFSDLITLQKNTDGLNEQLLEDTNGPSIRLYNNNIEVLDNTAIFSPYNFRIDILDNLPINMSGDHNHNLLFWINDEKNNALILNDMFAPSSDTSGSVILNFEPSKFEETAYYLNIESWDILSNNTVRTIRVNVNQNLNQIFNVYNFPNPFSEKTFFTFQMRDPQPIDIKITLYSKTGKKIITLEESTNEIKSYHVFPESGWDGTDRYKSQLRNGTYFYHLNINTIDGELLYDKIHKVTILK